MGELTGLTVGDLDEAGLLAQFTAHLPAGPGTILGPGDDAAVIAAPDSRAAVSLDLLTEGSHFRRDWSTGFEIGVKSATANVADIVAMGARPTSLVVGLGLPLDLPASYLIDLAKGLAHVCEPAGIGVVGGDLIQAPQLLVAIAAYGDLGGRAPVLRSGTRPGDVLAHVGALGQSAAGLALLKAGRRDSHPNLVNAHLQPICPLLSGHVIADAGATAMMDVSDGLLRDAARIATASAVGLEIDLTSEAIVEAKAPLASAGEVLEVDPLVWILGGGEDHGLIATFPPEAGLPPGFAQIGTVTTGAGITVTGGELPDGVAGWDHFGG